MTTTPAIEATHYIKLREKGRKSWSFLSRSGSNRLRIHAIIFSEKRAAEVLPGLESDNPEFEFRIVRA